MLNLVYWEWDMLSIVIYSQWGEQSSVLKQKYWPGALLVSNLKYLWLWFCQHDPALLLLANPISFFQKMHLYRAEMTLYYLLLWISWEVLWKDFFVVNLTLFHQYNTMTHQRFFLGNDWDLHQKWRYLEINETRSRGGMVLQSTFLQVLQRELLSQWKTMFLEL